MRSEELFKLATIFPKIFLEKKIKKNNNNNNKKKKKIKKNKKKKKKKKYTYCMEFKTTPHSSLLTPHFFKYYLFQFCQ